MTDPMSRFDISSFEPFSMGKRISIEASAGTGKTYSLTTIVARLVAEQGILADQFLMMTFTNEATEGLRQETRRRCQEALAHLQGAGQKEPWMSAMTADPKNRELYTSRLRSFLARFDEVNISTIHGFCQAVLKQTGLASLAPTNFELVPDVDHVIDQTITDLLAHKLSLEPGYLSSLKDENGASIKYSTPEVRKALYALRDVVITALNNEGALLLPASEESDYAIDPAELLEKVKNKNWRKSNPLAQTVADEVRRIVSEVQTRCHHQGLITYNDLISLVRQALDQTDPDGIRLASQLAAKFKVIMVDEFQDTDASQSAILNAIFEQGSQSVTLLTVGDPKQAIYRFRGADVNEYLGSMERADERYRLGTNWRSDKPLLDALACLMEGLTFDIHELVPFTSVDSAPGHDATQILIDEQVDAATSPNVPLEIRYIPRLVDFGATDVKEGKGASNNSKDLVHKFFLNDLTGRVIGLLNSARIPDDDNKGEWRRLRPSDIAILVHNHRDADQVVQSLTSFDIPAVQLKTGSVFETEAAKHWLMFTAGLARPAHARSVRSFALSWFGGLSEESLALSPVDEMVEIQRKCVESAELLKEGGVTALFLHFRNDAKFLERVLDQVNGLRDLTDLDHIAEVLAGLSGSSTQIGPAELHQRLTELVAEPSTDTENQQRRIQTDSQSVKVMTIHASKGLEFPVVFLPTLNRISKSSTPKMFPARLNGTSSVRVIDAASGIDEAKSWRFVPKGLSGVDVAQMLPFNSESKNPPEVVFLKKKAAGTRPSIEWGRKVMADIDEETDKMRLFYVAMTRAKHKVVAYWSPIDKYSPNDPFIKSIVSSLALKEVPVEREDLQAAFSKLEKNSHGCISAVDISLIEDSEVDLDVDEDASTVKALNVAQFTRSANSVSTYGFGRWSYSSVTKGLKRRLAEVVGDVEFDPLPGASDEFNEADTVEMPAPDNAGWSRLPAGARFGDGVHQVLDHIDPSSTNLSNELRETVDEVFAAWGDDLDRGLLTGELLVNLTTPLNEMFGGQSLASLGTTHRLSELRFDFPLRTRDSIGSHLLIEALVQHGELPTASRSHFQRVLELGVADTRLAGFMNGSIDAVFRIAGDDPKFIVSDYKTNKLHRNSDPNPLRAYDRQGMERAMIEDGYYIQALVYSVALHRYLRTRLSNYDFDTHFGGVCYLFLRGLNGSKDETGQLLGLYTWKPPRRLIEHVDALFTEELI